MFCFPWMCLIVCMNCDRKAMWRTSQSVFFSALSVNMWIRGFWSGHSVVRRPSMWWRKYRVQREVLGRKRCTATQSLTIFLRKNQAVATCRRISALVRRQLQWEKRLCWDGVERQVRDVPVQRWPSMLNGRCGTWHV